MAAILPFSSEEKQASRFSRIIRSPQQSWLFHEGAIKKLGYGCSVFLGAVRGSYVWQRAVTAAGRRLGWIGSDNFIILSAPRSGTTLMVDYLNCHPGIHCRGEILNRDQRCYGDPRRMDRQRLRLHVESFFVKPPGATMGAKILTYHLDELQISLADVTEVLSRPRIIVLYREQILDQYASLKLAEQSGVWHSKQPPSREPIRIDPHDFVEFANRERRMWQDNMPALDGVDAHFISYEQLTRRPAVAMRGVFEFLGMKPCPVASVLAKLQDKPLSKQVSNYGELLRSGIVSSSVLRLPFSRERWQLRAA